MPYRPLVSKIRVHNPNKVRASVANKNYIRYIATREGVALDNPEDMDELLRMPGMEKVNMDEQVIHEKVSNENYLRYIACRPRSHGLFGNIDTSDLNEVMKEVSDVSRQNRIIYRGIISLSEKDAEALNFKSTADWNQYLKKVMPGLAEKLGISPTDHTWVAAFHAEKTHPHVHYELWDNNDRVKSPFIHTSTQKKCREFLSKEMFDNEYERMIGRVYQEELEELKSIRNMGRASILQKSEKAIEEVIYTPGVIYEVLPDKINHEDAGRIKDEVNRLVDMMRQTEHGRIAYKLLPQEMKDQVNRIVDLLYKRADIQKEMEGYVGAVGDMQRYQGKTRTEVESSQETARQDMHRRVCNRVLKVVKDNYDFSAGSRLGDKETEGQMKNMDKDLEKQEGKDNRDVRNNGDDLQGEGKGWKSAQENVKGYEKAGMFDINMSYVLVKAALEEMRKQSMMQKARASGYSKQNRSHSRQNIKEEIKRNKDKTRELS